MASQELRIIDESGIHARPATHLVQSMSKYNNDIQLEYNNKSVNAKSIMGIMSLGVPYDAQIKISVNGDNAETVLADIIKTVKSQNLV